MAGESLVNIIVLLVVGNIATLILLLIVGWRLYAAIGRVRGDSRRANDTSKQLQREWEEYNEGQSGAIREKLAEIDARAETLEKNTAGRIEEFEELVTRTRTEIERLEKYLRDVFEVELKNVFDSFDNTVSGVLDEMKSELMRGVDRIEEIESLMGSRNAVEGQLANSHEAIQSLTTGESEGPMTPDDAMEVEAESQDILGQDNESHEEPL